MARVRKKHHGLHHWVVGGPLNSRIVIRCIQLGDLTDSFLLLIHSGGSGRSADYQQVLQITLYSCMTEDVYLCMLLNL